MALGVGLEQGGRSPYPALASGRLRPQWVPGSENETRGIRIRRAVAYECRDADRQRQRL